MAGQDSTVAWKTSLADLERRLTAITIKATTPRCAKRGESLFFNQHLSCFRCHGGFNFSDATVSGNNRKREIEFHNTGLYNLAGMLSYPAPNADTYEYTKIAADAEKFKAPTIPSGPNAGIGHDNPNKDHLIGGFELSAQDRGDLIAFLESLTDREVLHDPRFANPR